MSNPILLLDASAFLYRSYYAMPPLSTSKGQPTSVIKGVLNTIQNILRTYPNSEVAVVFDAKGKSFRNQLFADYKANRPPMPDDLKLQIPLLFEAIKALGLKIISLDGVEADDVIGTLARKFSHQGLENLIVSSDKDMAQLVDENSKILDPVKNQVLDADKITKKFELRPDQIIDWLALMGDKSDNIPGVEGVGIKTAVALLQEMDSINNIYENLDKIETLKIRGAKTLKQKLLDNQDVLILSKKLATIKTDCELDFEKEDLAKKPTDKNLLKKLFTELEFNELSFKFLIEHETNKVEQKDRAGEYEEDLFASENENLDYEAEYQKEFYAQELADSKGDKTRASTQIILTQTDFDAFFKKLSASRVFAIDIQTDETNYTNASLLGIAFCFSENSGFYIPFGFDYLNAPTQLDKKQTLTKLKPILEDESYKKIGYELGFVYKILCKEGIEIKNLFFDVLLASHILNSTDNHKLENLAIEYLGTEAFNIEDATGTGKNKIPINRLDVQISASYSVQKTFLSWNLSKFFTQEFEQLPKLEKLFREIEMPLVEILSNVEMQGVKLDINLLAKLSQNFGERIDAIEKQAFELAGEEFNLKSPKQLAEILFEKLKLPVIKKTPKGAISTAEEVLQELALDYPLPKLLIEHRSLQKLKNTYTDKLPLLVDKKTQRLHTNYHQAGTATGRLSSTDPNLQNIPIRSEGKEIRAAFISEAGYKILAADYSQIELRIMAHLSGDSGLINAFKEKTDIHRATASEVFGATLDEVSDNQRRSAKAINFGLIYGMGAFGLAKQLQVDRKQASLYIEKYFSRYEGVKKFMDEIRTKASEEGFVETIFGRRLYLPNINSKNKRLKSAAERTAINAPMQGSAADLIKKAMIDLEREIKKSNLDIKILMQVHDELVFEVKQSQTDEAKLLIKKIMENAMQLDIPLVVDIGVGDNWQEAH